MPIDPPPSEKIEDWIAGRLPDGDASEVEAYFEQHPEQLAEIELERGILKVAARTDFHDADLGALVDTLKAQSFETSAENQWMDLLQSTDRPGLIGRLGEYEILAALATTGMATVLKASDPELDRLVALKVLSHGLATDPSARERFLREARAMATLEHENILPIFGIHPEPVPWFAMRYIDGGTLQDALDEGGPRLAEAEFLESLATQMASALSKAHAAGIVHRDLKPANILIDRSDGHIWLTDFGIARSADDPGLTRANTVAGTPRYMSPEQAAGEEIDHRCDLFSLGSVLFHCATGRPPFEGDHHTAVIDRVKQGNTTPLRKLNPALPGWLAGAIDQLLQKSPADRPASADEFLSRIAARTRPPLRLKWWVTSAAAFFALAMGLWIFWPEQGADLPDNNPDSQTNTALNHGSGQRYTDLGRAITEAASGETLVLDGWFVLDEPIATRTRFDLHLKAAEGAEPTIEFKHQGAYGILIEGNASATGITFLCTERVEEDFVFLVARDASKVEIRHCTFDDRIPDGISWALKVEQIDQVVMDSCQLYGKELIACLISDSLDATTVRDCNFLMQDCCLEARAILLTRGRRPETEFDITLERNVLRGHTVIGYSSYTEPRPTRFTLVDNQFYVSSRHIHVARGPLELLADTLVWQGKGNTYTTGTPFVRISRPETQFIQTLDDFLEAIPNATETDTKFHDPAEKQEQ